MTPRLIIVVPCYNEQEVLPITAPMFLAKIKSLAQAGQITQDSRVMFVNDGSRDDTWNIITRLAEEDEHFIGISQSRNRGHQNAVLAGLMTAKDMCDITISIDCDGQDDINAMDGMVAAYHEGCEIVYGVRSRRDTDTFFKRFTAESFYKLLNAMGAGGGVQPRGLPPDKQPRAPGACEIQGGQHIPARNGPPGRIQEHLGVLRAQRARRREIPLSAEQNAGARLRRDNQPVHQAHQDDLRAGTDRGADQLRGDNLGGRGGNTREHRQRLGVHHMYHMLPQRSAAYLHRGHGEYIGKIYMEVKHRPRYIISEKTWKDDK